MSKGTQYLVHIKTGYGDEEIRLDKSEGEPPSIMVRPSSDPIDFDAPISVEEQMIRSKKRITGRLELLIEYLQNYKKFLES